MVMMNYPGKTTTRTTTTTTTTTVWCRRRRRKQQQLLRLVAAVMVVVAGSQQQQQHLQVVAAFTTPASTKSRLPKRLASSSATSSSARHLYFRTPLVEEQELVAIAPTKQRPEDYNGSTRTDSGGSSSSKVIRRSVLGGSFQSLRSICDSLSAGRLELPCTSLIVPRKKSSSSFDVDDDTCTSSVLTLRWMQPDDIAAVTTMCLDEYGSIGTSTATTTTTTTTSRGRGLVSIVQEWWDHLALCLLVNATMWIKTIGATTRSTTTTKTGAEMQAPRIQDHAVIVACLSSQKQQPESQEPPEQQPPKDNNNGKNSQIVGMIEISRQPVRPDRNPSPIPIPLLFKQLYCTVTKTPLQGWMSNVLVAPAARGCGVAQLLVAAAEGVAAQQWQCDSVHLHCDADTVSGRIPQRLYRAAGYRPGGQNAAQINHGNENNAAAAADNDLSWMMQSTMSSSSSHSSITTSTTTSPTTSMSTSSRQYSNSVYWIQGIALLYLQKDLEQQ